MQHHWASDLNTVSGALGGHASKTSLTTAITAATPVTGHVNISLAVQCGAPTAVAAPGQASVLQATLPRGESPQCRER